MNQKVNRKRFLIKDKISVWNVKVGIMSVVPEDDNSFRKEPKNWNFKVIMNEKKASVSQMLFLCCNLC
jgi:hypothetical protein